ncbi:MAG: DUF721 domain-containing protein [Betaproteobacteria bacterium]|nr:DUF721 domain-containing protein [Betaproteobacteria bacterium]
MNRLYSISSLLTSDEHLSRIYEKVALLASMQRALARVTSAEFARTCAVANIRGQTAIIHAINNAAAARLRLVIPKLLTALRESSNDVNAVKVEVQIPESATSGHRVPRKTTVPASAGALLRGLEERLPPSPLRNALSSLAKKSQP